MASIAQCVSILVPFSQAKSAIERRLGIALPVRSGECRLQLVFTAAEGQRIERDVKALTEALPGEANYTARYRLMWDRGPAAAGIPTPGFSGTLTVAAGEDYDETTFQLEGTYAPPGGALGLAFNELLGRRIAHATLAALLGGIGDEIRHVHESIEVAKRHA